MLNVEWNLVALLGSLLRCRDLLHCSGLAALLGVAALLGLVVLLGPGCAARSLLHCSSFNLHPAFCIKCTLFHLCLHNLYPDPSMSDELEGYSLANAIIGQNIQALCSLVLGKKP